MTIQTINLSGTEAKVTGIKANYLAIKNKGTETLYASKMAGIVPDGEDVLPIEPGDSSVLPIWDETAYLLGNGKAVIMGSSKCENFFKPIVDEETDVRAVRKNLLLNPNFTVNQRKVSGTISAPADIVDRWKLTEGTVSIGKDGLLLNGTISQTLNSSIGEKYSVSSNAGIVEYDDDTRVFSITASNELISYAKLEKGVNASEFRQPDYIEEMGKCQRYLCVISPYVRYSNTLISDDVIDFNIILPQIMISNPVFDKTAFCVKSKVGQLEEGFTFDFLTMSGSTVVIRATKPSHGLTKAYLEPTASVVFSVQE